MAASTGPTEAGVADGSILDAVTRPVLGAQATPPPDATVPDRLRVDEQADLFEPLPEAELDAEDDEHAAETPERRDAAGLLVALAAIAGIFTVALEFAQPTRLVLVARALLVLAGAGALVGRALTTHEDAADVHRLALILPPALTAVLPAWALLAAAPTVCCRTSFFAGTMIAVLAACQWLVAVAARPVSRARRALERHLDAPARRAAATGSVGAHELGAPVRTGEALVVEAGEVVPVDLEIREGEAEVVPWPESRQRVRRRAGDFVVAGARVVQGELRGVCTWADNDRAMARAMLDQARRPDVHAQIAQLSRAIVHRWSWMAGLIAGIAVTLYDLHHLEPIGAVMVALAVWATIGSAAAGMLGALTVARGVIIAAKRGIVYNNAAAWDLCGRTTAAAFCARGTLLRGEPDLAEVEALGEPGLGDELLALAAGAWAAEQHPTAIALRRAARSRGIAPDAVRNPRSLPGLGVAAVASSGDALCVGTRAFMLERRVSVAATEQRIAELEATGRSVTLVSRGGRLLGLLAFQDGLRVGARAAVQHLGEARIEPVLLSSDSRETCEAIGRALDIDHLRPELADTERGEAVARIKDTGSVVAVLGHSPADDAALRAADVSVALAGAGRAPDDFSVSLASDDVRDATLSLSLAHRTRKQAAQALTLVLGPALFGALVVAARLLPPEYAPLALLLGTATAVVHLRGWDRRMDPEG